MKKTTPILLTFSLFIATFFILQTHQELLVFSHDKIASGEIWRLWSGHFVHTNYKHLGLNTIGFAIFLSLYTQRIQQTWVYLYVLILSSSVGIGLYLFSPEIREYAGFSAILYGLFTLAAIKYVSLKDYLLGHLVIIAISIKIIWENFNNNINNTSSDLIHAPVATDAHLYGYASAIVIAFGSTLLMKKRH